MSDRLPGSSYDNPIRYRGYRIHRGDTGWTPWVYSHEDYDGPEDGRCGYGKSEAECRAEIDERLDD